MTTFKAKKEAATRSKTSAAKLLSTSALTAAGLLAFALNTARADDVVIPDVGIPETTSIETPTIETNNEGPAWTGFTDEEGSITVETPSDTLTNITQNTQLYVGTSGNLDIPEGYHVNIDQGASNWLFVAKAAPDADPTYILGRLTADGRVIIIDRNGVFTGKDSVIDVAGVIMTTGDIKIEDLKSSDFGKYQVTNITEGSIELNGTVTVANAGLAAFVAPSVANNGVINAKMGKVAMASGEVVTLDLYGDNLVEIGVVGSVADALVKNSGAINAQGGVVQISAAQAKEAVDNIINVSGIVDVSSVTQEGGKIVLSGGNSGVVSVSGKLDASGATGGGKIDVQGNKFVATTGSEIKADGGNGHITMWGDDKAIYAGIVSAQGDNGFIETSGGQVGVHGSILLGETGSWLLDPTDLDIVHSAGDGGVVIDGTVFSVGDPAPGDSWYWLSDATINSVLNAGGDVTLQTHNDGTREGDITLQADAAILKNAGDDSTFRLEAHDDIELLGTITANGVGTGKLNVELIGDYDNSGGNADVFIRNVIDTNGGNLLVDTADDIDVTNNAIITTDGGSILFNTRGTGDGSWVWMPGTVGTGQLISSGGNITINTGKFTLQNGSGIDAGTGNIDINNTGVAEIDANTLTVTGSGKIDINQNAGGSIQAVINSLNNLGSGLNTVSVGAGTYNESVDITENNITLFGANSGKAGNNGTRTAETTIHGTNGYSIYVGANDVTIDGLTVEGSTLSSGYRDAIWTYNADDLGIRNNIITNGDFGITSWGGTSTDGVIEKNLISNMDGHGVYISENQYLNVLNNVLTGVSVGITTENFYNASSTGNRGLIDGNVISASDIGIRNNLSYGSQSGFTISNNTITAEDTANTRRWTGIDVISQMGGAATEFTNNDIDGSAVNATRQTSGYELTNMTSANRAIIDGGEIKNVDVGVWATDGSFYTGAVSDLLIKNVAFSNNGIGILAEDTEDVNNDIGINVNPTSTKITVGTGNTFTTTGHELAIAGDNVTVALEGGFLGFNDVLVKGAGPANYAGNPYGTTTNLTTNNSSINQGIGLTVAGGTTNVGAGTYTENLLINKALKLNGNSATLKYDIVAGGGSLITVTADNVNIDPFVFDGMGIANYGINANSADNLIVDGNTFQNFLLNNINVTNSSGVRIFGNTMTGGQKGVYADNAPDIWVYTNNINGATVAGVHVVNTNASDYFGDIDIFNNAINSAASANGIVVENSNYATVGAHLTNQPDLDDALNGNVITGGVQGIVVNNSSNAMVRHNHVSNTSNNTIQINNGNGVQVLDNVLSNIGWDGVQFNASTNAAVKNNSITNVTGASGIAVMYGSNGTVIDHNTINGADRLGIYAWNSDNLQIKNNLVNDTGREGGNNWFLSAIHLEGVDGTTVDNNNIDNSNGSGIRVGGIGNQAAQNTSGNVITSNTISNVDQDGIRVSDSASVKINGNFVGYTEAIPETFWIGAADNNIKGDGIVIINSDGTAGNKTEINNNFVYSTATTAFDKGSSIQVLNSDHVNILNNSLLDSEWDYIRLDSEGGSIDNLLVQGNTGFLGAQRVGIYAENLTNSTINNNNIQDTNRYAGIYTTGGGNLWITNNTVRNADEVGILVKNSGLAFTIIDNNKIDSTGLDIKASDGENSGDGIRVINANSLVVTNNKIGYGFNGALGGGDDTIINGNGIFVDPSNNALISQNKIVNAKLNGIYSLNNNNATIQNNTINNSTLDGILIEGGNTVLVGGPTAGYKNVITNSGDDGIDVRGVTGVATVKYNTIDTTAYNPGYYDGNGTGHNGIEVRGLTGAIVDHNDIKNAGNDGIEVIGNTGSQITYNTIDRSGFDGISTEDGSGVVIDHNTISNSLTASGIAIHDTLNAIASWNTVSNSSLLGIYGQNANGIKIEDNTVTNSGTGAAFVGHPYGNGIGVEGAAGVTIKRNTVTTSKSNGISVGLPINNGVGTSTNVVVDDNKVTGTGVDGIVVNGGAVTVSGNIVNTTGDDGIDVRGSSYVDIKNNKVGYLFNGTTVGTVNNITGNGISVINSDHADIMTNTITEAVKDGIFLDPSDYSIISGNTILNVDGDGIDSFGNSFVKIGGTTNADRNFITNTGLNGVRVEGGTDNLVQRNVINGTGKLLIADGLSGNGVYVKNSANVDVNDNRIGYKQNGAADYTAVVDSIFGDGILITGSNNAEIKGNFITETVSPVGDSGSGIQILNSDGVVIGGATSTTLNNPGVSDRNTISNTGWDGIRVANGSDNITINNNKIDNVVRTGIYLGFVNTANVLKNLINGTSTHFGIDVAGGDLITLDTNEIDNTAQDGILATSVATNGLVIKNNKIGQKSSSVIGDNGIEVQSSHGAKIIGNIVARTVTNGILVNASNDVEVGGTTAGLGNTITRAGLNGILVTGGTSAYIGNNKVLGTNASGSTNGIAGAQQDGIRVENNANVEIVKNTVQGGNGAGLNTGIGGNGANRYGIAVDNSFSADVIDNDVIGGNNGFFGGARGKSAGSDGIHVTSSDFSQINLNEVNYAGGHGIYLNPSHDSVINANNIHDVALNGINVLSSDRVDVTNNTMYQVGQNGIFANDSDDIDVINNTVGNLVTWGANLDGIHINGGVSALIQNNKVYGGLLGADGAGEDGIYVLDNDGVEVLGNLIASGQGLGGGFLSGGNGANNHGIAVYSSNNAVIDTNIITGDLLGDGIGAGVDGVHVEDSNNLTVGGLIPVMNGNKIFSTGRDGINIERSNTASVLNNIIGGVPFMGVAQDGIDMNDTSGTLVAGNIITDVGQDGIQFSNGDLSLIALNFITNAGHDGIDIDNASLLAAVLNQINGTGEDGIETDDTLLTLVGWNTITDAGDDGIDSDNALLSFIIGNDITTPNGDGIEFSNGGLSLISDNTITDAGDDGIDLDGITGLTLVSGNTVDNATNNGIEATNTFLTAIIDNDVDSAGDNGIDVRDSAFVTISGNNVTNSDDHGIFVDPSFFIDISGNFVAFSGDDGIHVDDVIGLNISDNIVLFSENDGIDVDNILFADIHDNTVAFSGENGIEASDIGFSDIRDNNVFFSGRDGINVTNSLFNDITNNFVMFAFGDGIDVTNSLFADINDNTVRFVGGDGIEVTNSLFADINNNNIRFVGDDGIDVTNSLFVDINDNDIRFTGGDGIQVRNSLFADIDNNYIRFAGDDGIDFENGLFGEITNNDIRFVDENGIEINDSGFISVDNNIVSDADEAGIFIDPSFNIYVTNNEVSNSDIGLYVAGPNNGYIEVTGNTFTNNRVGARFESGIIDLTKISSDPGFGPYGNKFIAGVNGLVGMEFDAFRGDTEGLSLVRAGGGYTYDGLDYDTLSENDGLSGAPLFGGTIGNQYFEGYNDPVTQQMVTLGDNTFVDPLGDAIWLDASNSTFNTALLGTFSPATDGLTVDRLAFLQSMFFHQPDAAGRGIFWFGVLPDGPDVLRDTEYDAFNGDVSGLNVVITGLPRLGPTAPPQGGELDLNAIAPAAGEGAEAAPATTNVAEIEPAAGGEGSSTQAVSCWGDAVSAAGSGAPVSYSYGGTFEESISAAATCGSQSF